MEYNSLMEPLLCIFLAMSLGFLIGSLGTLHLLRKEKKELSKELDKERIFKCQKKRLSNKTFIKNIPINIPTP